MIRTLVVASATMAILLVCFSMYQFSQLEHEPPVHTKPRLPEPRTEASLRESTAGNIHADTEGGMIGSGRDIKITLYSRDGNRARLEIEVHDWTPKPGSSNEFILVEPMARMRTNDGNAVRISARRGVLEAKRHGGGSLDPQRGRLTGNVLIEFDRLTEKQRAAIPEELRHPPDPSQIIRVETEEIEFDLEYSKLIMPYPVHLVASDIEFSASNLEIRFNDDESQIESLRINQGGKIILRGAGEALGLSIPGMDQKQDQQFSMINWLHNTLQAALDSNLKPPTQETLVSASTNQTAQPPTVDGIPIFRSDSKDDKRTKPRIKYFARFEGNVLVHQHTDDVTTARLEADLLEIVREFSAIDKNRVQANPSSQHDDATQHTTKTNLASEVVELTWTKRLVLEALNPEDAKWKEAQQATINAMGSPVRLSHPDGDAVCSKLTYHPDGNEVWLFGDEENPAIVRSVDQGKIVGTIIHTHNQSDEFTLQVDGPGTLQPASQTTTAMTSTSVSQNPSPVSARDASISFQDQLVAHGRVLTKTSLNFTGGLSSRRFRILDTATITGQANIKQGNTDIEGDSITLVFGTMHTNREIHQTIERLQCEGHVVMSQDQNRITSDAIDVQLATTKDGRIHPITATATGHVEVTQDQQVIKADDRLIIDFALIPQYDTYQKDQLTDSAESLSDDTMQTGIKRIRAYKNVSVVDLNQKLKISAESLDCTLINGREIDTAQVSGSEDQPAVVQLDTFTLTSKNINLNVTEQSAEVPGHGRMTFQSLKDLNGRKLSEPIPITISWGNWLKYRGKDNRAIFDGQVHATSQTTTTFDCNQLLVEFDDVPQPTPEPVKNSKKKWLDTFPIVKLMIPLSPDRSSKKTRQSFSKELALILATGNAVALTSELDSTTGQLKSRARITGPKLSVNLRSEVSKMLIEGEGSLQLEDFQPADLANTANPYPPQSGDLFDLDNSAGPSKTLITWNDSMWYDFSIDQVRFEGDVELKYFSGQALQRLFGTNQNNQATAKPGRSTFLSSDVLTVDFLDRQQQAQLKKDRRMGRISTNALRQFQASGNVKLQDQSEGLELWADRIIYERPRKLLAIYGTDFRKAKIIKRLPNKMPYQFTAKHLFYNLGTGEIEVLSPKAWGQ